MKSFSIILLTFLCCSFSTAQERFFEFIPGWRGLLPIEQGDSYVFCGYGNDVPTQHHYQLSSLDLGGNLTAEWIIDIDSADFIQSRYVNSFSERDGHWSVFGSMRTVNGPDPYGVFLTLDESSSATDTIILEYDNGTTFFTSLESGLDSFLVTGYFRDASEIEYTTLIKMDTLGNIGWQRDFYCTGDGVECQLEPYHVLPTPDGGYLLTCTEWHDPGGSQVNDLLKTMLIKTDAMGNEQWRIHPGSEEHWIDAGWPVMLDNGNVLFFWGDPRFVVDMAIDQINDQANLHYAEIDLSDGSILYEEDYFDILATTANDPASSHVYEVTQVQKLDDGNILISGRDQWQGFLMKVDQSAEPIWIRRHVPPAIADGIPDYFVRTQIYGVSPTSDGGFICTGEFRSDPNDIWPSGIQSAFAMKLDEYGCLEENCHVVGLEEEEFGQLRIFPNPATDEIRITFPLRRRGPGGGHLTIHDLTGKQVLKMSDVELRMSDDQVLELNVSKLTQGVYFLHLASEKGVYSGKFIKE